MGNIKRKLERGGRGGRAYQQTWVHDGTLGKVGWFGATCLVQRNIVLDYRALTYQWWGYRGTAWEDYP